VRRIPPQNALCHIEQYPGHSGLFYAHPIPPVPRDPSASYISIPPRTTHTHITTPNLSTNPVP
jgi:hypothetical protein